MAKTKSLPPLQLEPLPEICDKEWVKRRYGISQRMLEQLAHDGKLTPFKPGYRDWRFRTYEVVAAMEGEEVARSRRYLPLPPSDHATPNGQTALDDDAEEIDADD